MSSLPGRRGPNVSKYIADLNIIPSEQDMAPTAPFEEDEFAPFLNTDFFDWDMGETTNMNQASAAFESASIHQRSESTASKPGNAFAPNMFPDAPSFANMPIDPSLASQSAPTSQPYPQAPALQQYSSPVSTTSPASPGSASKQALSLEEQSRFAAEEDKRRRNTAASARFRVKKKQREQALERSEKEMRERNSQLEAKVVQLEMENKWLRGLVTDKTEGMGRDIVGELLASKLKDGKDGAKRKHDDSSSSTSESSSKKSRDEQARKDGVGTVKQEA